MRNERSVFAGVSSCSLVSTWSVRVCIAARVSGGASATQPPKTYGGISGGASPSIRRITRNGVPSHCGSSSTQRTSGAGTSVRARTRFMHLAWSSMSYSGNTGYTSGIGASRAA